MTNIDISKWLDDCPTVVLGRIIEEIESLKSISIAGHIYGDDTLVVVPVKTIREIFDKMDDNQN